MFRACFNRLFAGSGDTLWMQKHLATVLGAVFLMGSAYAADAADLGDTFSGGGCNCGSDMIVVYDSEPGVITRRWKSDCDCRYAPDPARPYRAVAPARGPQYESLIEPWRR